MLAYAYLTDFADVVVAAFGLERGTHFAEAVHFFFYDTPKVLLLLIGIVFLMGVIHTFFSPERTRALLSGKRVGVGNVLAASLGIVTPFCSCSAVPLFIGFVSAGVPLGVTFSFLIAAPMVNEVALALLFGMFGWQVAALYLGPGLTIAIVAGCVIGELKMERHLEDWVCAIQAGEAQAANGVDLTWVERFEAGAAPRARKSSARSGRTSSSASRSARAFTAMCRRTSWPRSWARTRPGGRCRRPCCWACRCTPTPPASSRSSRR